MPRLAIVVAVSWTVALIGLPATSSAVASAAPTCQLQTATITSSGGPVTGTEGSDVIVATGTTDIQALGGDDTICMEHGTVDAGPGDDVVIGAELAGPGTDSFLLGPGYDYLDVPMPPGSHITADAGDSGDHDGRGPADEDYVLISGVNDTEDWVVDLAGSVRRGGVEIAALSGFGTFHLDFGNTTKVEVLGTDAPEYLLVAGGDLAADMAGGRDHVNSSTYGETIGHITGGVGKDRLTLSAQSLTADLATGDMGDGLRIDGFDRFYFQAYKIRVAGSASADDIEVYSYRCNIVVDGRGGDDRIENESGSGRCLGQNVLRGGRGDDLLKGGGRPERMAGGTGDDRLVGGAKDDVLIGGAGRDTADGGLGSADVCRAEVERGCER